MEIAGPAGHTIDASLGRFSRLDCGVLTRIFAGSSQDPQVFRSQVLLSLETSFVFPDAGPNPVPPT